MDDHFLNHKLDERSAAGSRRTLLINEGLTDFFSNDYLGIVKNKRIEKKLAGTDYDHGSTGSRLLSGNYSLIEETESKIAAFHRAGSALIFNSGYDANVGLLACIAQKGDLILYDKLSHASIRDGIRLSFADSFSFIHNDADDLKGKLEKKKGRCFVVTESVFSMDGDRAPLAEIAALCNQYGAFLIVDEAHATGVIGNRGEGLVQFLGLEDQCFARVHTFGKALGCHGAAILGSGTLRDFLINFSRPFIYSTAMPPVGVAAIRAAYEIFPDLHEERIVLSDLIQRFHEAGISKSLTPIQTCIKSGNRVVKEIAQKLFLAGLNVRPILHPTVPLGKERLRIALHSFNTPPETERLISILQSI